MSSEPSRSRHDPVGVALDTAAQRVVEAVVALGVANAVVLIDGRSGAGKSSLAHELVARWPLAGRVQLVALDSLYPGWDGLAAGVELAEDLVLRPHARGIIGVWQRWDWADQGWAEAHAVDPSLPLIVEGSGILTPETSRLGDIRVWVESPPASRRRRAIDRDGETFRPHWDRWARQEDDHVARHDPRGLADIVVAVP